MENGEVAHGVMDPDSIARRSEVAPRISEELKRWLIEHLDEGLTARQVFEEHKKETFKRQLLLHKHVRYYKYQKKKKIGTCTKIHW